MTTRPTPRLCPAAVLLGIALPALAQVPAVTKYTNISLGSVVPGATAGTVVLNTPSASRTSTGGANLGPSVGVSLGTLTLSGKAGDNWSVSAGSAIPFTLTGPSGATMQATVVDFEPSTTNTGTFPASGTTGFFYLGITLAVGTSASLPAGTYTGSFSLQVNDTTNGRNSATAFSVSAKVDPVITLVKLTDLRFGDIYTSASAGTVLLTPAGARSATGGASLGALSPVGSATFTVTGAASATYAISLPATITLSSPGGTLTVSPVTSTPSLTGLLSATGQQTLAVGGTLNVAANQADGDYAGLFNVTVAYN
jgi:hypothetical protein